MRDHVGNMVKTASTGEASSLTDSMMMQVSCTDSDKSPTESTYDLPLDSSSSLPTVCRTVSFAHTFVIVLIACLLYTSPSPRDS